MSTWTFLNVFTIALYAATTVWVTIRRAPAPMGGVLILTQASALSWSLGEMLAVWAPDLTTKHAALTLLHAGGIVLPLSWMLLALRFAEAHGGAPAWAGTWLERGAIGWTVAMLVLAVTNPWHGGYLEPHVHAWNERRLGWALAAGGASLQLWITLAVYLSALLGWGAPPRVRRQLVVLSLASIAPVVMVAAEFATGPHPYPIELGIVGGSIGGILVLVSIRRGELFDLTMPAVSAVIAEDSGAVLYFDARERLRFASDGVEQVLGGWLSQQGRRLEDLPRLLGGADRGGSLLGELRAGAPAASRRIRVFDGGAERRVWCDAERIDDRRGRPVGYALRLQDVTELEALEAEHVALAERLAATERLAALGRLTADFAERIREPVDAIHGEASRALEALDEQGDGPAIDAALDRIDQQAQRCGDLTRAVLALAREARDRTS